MDIVVGVINFVISINEGNLEEISGYYDPRLRDSIIKNLRRLNYQKSDDLVLDENDELKLQKVKVMTFIRARIFNRLHYYLRMDP